MNFKLFDWLKPAENEVPIKTYHCTTLQSKLLNLKAEGYLVTTTKRVVFHALGSSYTGESVLQSEVPIEDVSGITCYSGGYFSIMHFLGALLATIIIGAVIDALLLRGIISAIMDSIQNNPSATYDTLKNAYNGVRVVFWILAIAGVVVSFFIAKEKILRSILAGLGFFFLVNLGGTALLSDLMGSSMMYYFEGGSSSSGSTTGTQITLLLAALAAIYALVCMFWYGRRTTMSLFVGSKGGSNTPIAISGIRSFGTAGKALSAEPAEDVEPMIKQLGAMITDVQQLGEIGVEKWKTE